VTIAGRSLPDSPRDVEVVVGSERAQVVEATPTRVVARIPLVTRASLVQLPLLVRAGDWESSSVMLTILPKEQRPLDLAVAARYDAEAGAWELATPLGPLFLLRG